MLCHWDRFFWDYVSFPLFSTILQLFRPLSYTYYPRYITSAMQDVVKQTLLRMTTPIFSGCLFYFVITIFLLWFLPLAFTRQQRAVLLHCLLPYTLTYQVWLMNMTAPMGSATRASILPGEVFSRSYEHTAITRVKLHGKRLHNSTMHIMWLNGGSDVT